MKNKPLVLLSITSLILLGIYFYHSRNTPILIVGNNVEQRGCKPSTGYIYSKVKDACIRVFETGIRLNPQDVKLDKSLSAFAVFKSEVEDGQVEIFLPYGTSTIILSRLPDNGAGTWGNKDYKLLQWKGMYTLEDNKGNTLYQGDIAPN